MTPLTIVAGDATRPQANGPKVIAHLCNDAGHWGKGFVVAVSARWPEPERDYRAWHRQRPGSDFGLGAVQLVQVEHNTWVANMIGQHGIAAGRLVRGEPPIRYEAVEQCLAALAERALWLRAGVHMPRIGCGLAGGTWDRVEPIVARTLCARDVAVTVYDI